MFRLKFLLYLDYRELISLLYKFAIRDLIIDKEKWNMKICIIGASEVGGNMAGMAMKKYSGTKREIADYTTKKIISGDYSFTG